MRKKNKGITLISLVITIIVLLLIAGISIAMLTGENGILTRANESVEKNKLAEAEEKVKLAVIEYELLLHDENYNGNVKEFFEGHTFDFEVEEKENAYIIKKDGYSYEIQKGFYMNVNYVVGKNNIDLDIVVSASQNSSEVITGYKIYYKKILDPEYAEIIVDQSTNNLQYTISNLEYLTQYEVKVVASLTNSEASKMITMTTLEKYDSEIAKENGFGNGSDGILDGSVTYSVTDQSQPIKKYYEDVYLPVGSYINTNQSCAGIYIYSQNDIIINGNINLTGKGYGSSSVPSFVTVANQNISLAKAGDGGTSQGGQGGGTGNGGTNSGGVGQIMKGSYGTHTTGGYGNKTVGNGGAGAYLRSYNSAIIKGSSGGITIIDSTPITNGAGTIVLVARGDIIINGSIISTGSSATSRGGNGTAAERDSNSGYQGGTGGKSGTGGNGGGAVTIIYGNEYQNNGNITLTGGNGVGTGGTGANYYRYNNISETKWYALGGKGGTSGAGATGQIITRKVDITEEM